MNLLGRPPGTPKFAHNIASYCEEGVVYLIDELSKFLEDRTTKRSYSLVFQQKGRHALIVKVLIRDECLQPCSQGCGISHQLPW